MSFMILTDQEDGFVKVVEFDEGREGQDHDYPDVNQVLRGVLVVEVWKYDRENSNPAQCHGWSFPRQKLSLLITVMAFKLKAREVRGGWDMPFLILRLGLIV